MRRGFRGARCPCPKYPCPSRHGGRRVMPVYISMYMDMARLLATDKG